MAKINYSEVEKAFDDAFRRLYVENLTELASIANAIQEIRTGKSDQDLEKLMAKFQQQLKKIKDGNAYLYSKLNLIEEDEKRLSKSYREFNHEDWQRIKELKLHIEDLNRELQGGLSKGDGDKGAANEGEIIVNPKDEKHVEKQRVKHINKRFNVREGWVPLK